MLSIEPSLSATAPRVAAIEAGGTKFWVNAGTRDTLLSEPERFATATPEITLPHIIAALRGAFARQPFQAIGIATFGPVGVNPQAENYGVIGSTPKAGWQGFNFLSALAEFGVPVAVDTDVNAAALAEAAQHTGTQDDRLVYITVGTGIGGGIAIGGQPSNGVSHPELGHIRVARHPEDPLPSGICPFHDHCLEGLASGPAIYRRWGCDLGQLPQIHPGHRLTAYYLAQLCTTLLLTLAPGRIVLGGGVMSTPALLGKVRQQTEQLLGGYLTGTEVFDSPTQRITAPELAPLSGLAGAGMLAENVLRKQADEKQTNEP